MKAENRYKAVLMAIEEEKVKVFYDLWDYVSIETLAEDMGIFRANFLKYHYDYGGLYLGTAARIAEVIGVEREIILEFIARQVEQDRKSRRKRSRK